jgi:hypothetical protein
MSNQTVASVPKGALRGVRTKRAVGPFSEDGYALRMGTVVEECMSFTLPTISPTSLPEQGGGSALQGEIRCERADTRADRSALRLS